MALKKQYKTCNNNKKKIITRIKQKKELTKTWTQLVSEQTITENYKESYMLPFDVL